GQDLMAPLVARLHERGFSRAILIPGGHLGLLPLHAARISAAGAAPRYAIDELDVTYAVSGRAALAGRQALHTRSTHGDYLCGVGNPQPSPSPLRYGV